jgi:hypothetical protein
MMESKGLGLKPTSTPGSQSKATVHSLRVSLCSSIMLAPHLPSRTPPLRMSQEFPSVPQRHGLLQAAKHELFYSKPGRLPHFLWQCWSSLTASGSGVRARQCPLLCVFWESWGRPGQLLQAILELGWDGPKSVMLVLMSSRGGGVLGSSFIVKLMRLDLKITKNEIVF